MYSKTFFYLSVFKSTVILVLPGFELNVLNIRSITPSL